MYPNLIHHIRKYVPLKAEEIPVLLAHVKQLSIKKKDFLLKEGQVCNANYFVETGCLRMFFINDKGIEQITQFALENWWIAEQNSLLRQVKSQFYIQAVENAAIISIDHRAEDQLFKQLPQLEKYFRIMAQIALSAAQQRVKFFHDYSKEESYRHFIAMFPAFAQRIPQYMLASYLGLTPEYLSELRKKG